jgi:putative transposase
LWGRLVTSANTSDQAGFRLVFARVIGFLVRVVKVYVDQGYQGLASFVVSITGGHALLEIVRAAAGQKGFEVQPKRWIVERSISWLNWSRRLSKDYEQTTASSRAWIDVSAIRCTLRKLQA